MKTMKKFFALFLALALRYRPELKDEDRVADLTEHIFTSAEDPTVLKGIDIRQNGTTHTITPVLFQRMRPILAAQNGIVLESDDANPELVEAERDIAEQTAPELDYDLGSLVSSLAALTGTEESDVYNWPVLKFTRRQEALERVFSFLVYGVASASGAKFKGGNPVPSPFFARKERDSGTLIDMAAFTRGHNVAVSKTHPDLSPR